MRIRDVDISLIGDSELSIELELVSGKKFTGIIQEDSE